MTVRLRMKPTNNTLCHKCRNSQIVEGRAAGGGPKQQIYCSYLAMSRPLTVAVDSCNTFEEINSQTLREMHMKAWLLVNEPGKKVGFIHPKKVKRSWAGLISSEQGGEED